MPSNEHDDSCCCRDKAGGYGIQGVGGTFVERVDGDYFTVVGLPLYRVTSVLYNMFKESRLT